MRRKRHELSVPSDYDPVEQFSVIGERCLGLNMQHDDLGLRKQRSLLVSGVEHAGRTNLNLGLVATYVIPDEGEAQLDSIRAHWLTLTHKTIDHNGIFRYELDTHPVPKLYADMTAMERAIEIAETCQGRSEAA